MEIEGMWRTRKISNREGGYLLQEIVRVKGELFPDTGLWCLVSASHLMASRHLF